MAVGTVKTFKDLMEQHDRRIVIQHYFWFGHSVAATVANVNKAWGASTISDCLLSFVAAIWRNKYGHKSYSDHKYVDSVVQCDVMKHFCA
ncbi:hypothetical protein TNCV_1596831 [Trichonephila clavipes]|nr:hypothetical protein TNCV_1596831 [Trichonephila clavipes]